MTTLPVGKVFFTMEALFAFAQALDEEPKTFLARHASGDWGEVDERTRKENEYNVRHDLPVLSMYTLRSGAKIIVKTDAHRGRTSFLVPQEC